MDCYSELNGIECRHNFNLSENTTFGLGGLCRTAYFPKTEEEAITVFDTLNKYNEQFFVLGKGSNVLASDGFYGGAVISTAKLKGIKQIGNNRIECLSGTTVAELLKFCVERGLGGLEFLAGIPASVGGLTYMNAGAGGKFISNVLEECAVYDGDLRKFTNKSCNFSYKHSTMRDINCVILNSVFNMKPVSSAEVKEKIKYFLNLRASQPKGKTCGCVFKNPCGYSAGKLIDECGLKGLSFGGAQVSEKHGNFIINSGGNASDVYFLIQKIKKAVYEKTGISLEEEVVYIGDFNGTYG